MRGVAGTRLCVLCLALLQPVGLASCLLFHPPLDRIRIMRPSCIRACINISKYELERSRSAAVVHRTFVTLLAAF